MSKLYKHVLLATNLSKECDSVIKHGAHIAKTNNAKISVVYVLPRKSEAYAGEFSIVIDQNFEDNFEKNVKSALKKLSKQYDILSEDEYIVEGSLQSAITDLAQKINADLIVMGTHHHEGLHALFNSHAASMLNAVACDVLVVHIKN